jgi:hypothetical protein
MGVRLALPIWRCREMALVSAAAFLGVVVLRLPVIAIVLMLAPFGFLMAWFRNP